MSGKWNIYVKYNSGIYYIRQGSKAGLRLVVKSVSPVISQSPGIWQLILCSGRFKRKTLPLYTNLILSVLLNRCINKITYSIINSTFKFCVHWLKYIMKWKYLYWHTQMARLKQSSYPPNQNILTPTLYAYASSTMSFTNFINSECVVK